MGQNHTKLLDFTINPDFSSGLLGLPLNKIAISSYFSFDMERDGRILHCTIYSGKEGQVNISETSYGGIDRTILMDYCQTPDDFKNMLDKLDDLLTRMPKRDERDIRKL